MNSILRLSFIGLLSLSACADAIGHQRQIGAMHTTAYKTCKAKPAACALLQDCSADLRKALAAWQRVNDARVAGDFATEETATADAMIAEGSARAICAVANASAGKVQ